MNDARGETTRLLEALNRGEQGAFDALLALVYAELHALAARALARERKDHTLQPTALVHECYLKLVGQERARFESRGHFLAVAATAMRRVLVNHAKARGASKRGGGTRKVTLDDAVAAAAAADDAELLELDAALDRLAALDARKAKVVELRWFAGLEVSEAAEALGVSPATVKRDFDFAKTWLLREVSRDA